MSRRKRPSPNSPRLLSDSYAVMSDEAPLWVAIVGPTGSGKSQLALELAKHVALEVVSCDSQAIYRGLDIGTAKPSGEERASLPHHLVDVAEPWEDFSAARYAELADQAIAAIRGRGKLPLVVGGTGLYLRALLYGIADAPPKDPLLRRALEQRAVVEAGAMHRELAEVDAEAAARIEPADHVRIVRALEVYRLTGKPMSWHHRRHAKRPRYRARIFGWSPSREELYRRIEGRAVRMFEQGLVEETGALAEDPRIVPRLRRVMGYREALAYLEGHLTLDEAIERVAREQRRYAKRQLTWFRAMDEVEWLPWGEEAGAVAAQILAETRE